MAEHKEASVEIVVSDEEGKPIVSPVILDLKTTYVFQLEVINRTKTTGRHPYEAELEIGFGISLNGIDVVPYAINPPRLFAPDQVVDYTMSVYIPREYAGLTGSIIAKVLDPFGGLLASAKKSFSVGYVVSPDAKYEVPGRIVAKEGVDMPYLNPELDNQEGVVIGGVASKPPYRQPAPPKPKVTPIVGTKEEAPGISCPITLEPKVEFEGEVPVGGRLG